MTPAIPRVIEDANGETGLVSVIIPTYNRAYILPLAIESALTQSYPSVEVVVVDDGSTDATRELVERYDSRVRYLRQENAGPGVARNAGLRACRGEFIALLDSDDVWFPWKLAVQVAILQREPLAGMVWTDMHAVDEFGAITSKNYLRTMYEAHSRIALTEVMERRGRVGDLPLSDTTDLADHAFYVGDIFPFMMLGSLVHTSTVMLRRSRLLQTGGFDESLKVSGEDYEFYLRASHAGPVVFADLPSMAYRVGTQDQLTDPRHMVHIARNNLLTLERWIDRARERVSPAQWEEIAMSVASAHGWLGNEEFAAGNCRRARSHLWKGLRGGVGSWGSALRLMLCLLPKQWTSWIATSYRTRKGSRPASA